MTGADASCVLRGLCFVGGEKEWTLFLPLRVLRIALNLIKMIYLDLTKISPFLSLLFFFTSCASSHFEKIL